MGNTRRDNLLSSWKEIAAYLDCDIRTCQRWEKKFGLPVYRVDEESGSRVYAYKDELDEWLKNRNNKNSSPSKAKFQKLKQQIRPSILLPLIIVGGFVIYFLFLKTSTSPVPSDFRIENANLVILNEDGKELWQYDTGIKNLVSEQEYRLHFQSKNNRTDRIGRDMPHIMIKDINNDNHSEVLFSIQTKTEFGEGRLLCFNHKGDLLWDFETGRELEFGQKIYSRDYRIFGFEECDLNHDGKLEIIVISYHFLDFPTQLVMLNSEGRKIGEYWNSGRFADLNYVDLDEDGRQEIIVAGMNNEYTKASIIVLDPSSIGGCSPQEKEFWKCKDIELGTEKYYIIFPQIDVLLVDARRDIIAIIDVLQNKRISGIGGNSGIIYEFNFRLELQNVRLGHSFQRMHKKAVAEGKVKSELDENYIRRLEQGLLYWNGDKWVSEPTRNRYWNNSEN